jgi:hypothetical protein
MLRIVAITFADTAVHSLSSLLPALPAGAIQPTNVNFLAIRASDANSGAVTVNVGGVNNATDGFLAVAKGDPTFVIDSSRNSIALKEIFMKSAVGAIVEVVLDNI